MGLWGPGQRGAPGDGAAELRLGHVWLLNDTSQAWRGDEVEETGKGRAWEVGTVVEKAGTKRLYYLGGE